jgi:hypothetical protein
MNLIVSVLLALLAFSVVEQLTQLESLICMGSNLDSRVMSNDLKKVHDVVL